jgi:hypothetical protein
MKTLLHLDLLIIPICASGLVKIGKLNCTDSLYALIGKLFSKYHIKF